MVTTAKVDGYCLTDEQCSVTSKIGNVCWQVSLPGIHPVLGTTGRHLRRVICCASWTWGSVESLQKLLQYGTRMYFPVLVWHFEMEKLKGSFPPCALTTSEDRHTALLWYWCSINVLLRIRIVENMNNIPRFAFLTLSARKSTYKDRYRVLMMDQVSCLTKRDDVM